MDAVSAHLLNWNPTRNLSRISVSRSVVVVSVRLIYLDMESTYPFFFAVAISPVLVGLWSASLSHA